MKIQAICTGKSRNYVWGDKTISTAIFKDQLHQEAYLHFLNLEHDEQANLKVHGGPDKALYVLGGDSYSAWAPVLNDPQLPKGALGENLSLSKFDESQIFVGDTFQVGEAIVQATEPRIPCFKLNLRFRREDIISHFLNIGRSGSYFRVLKEGQLRLGDEFKLISQEPTLFSIDKFFRFIVKKIKLSEAEAKAYSEIPSLPEVWKEKLLGHP